VHQRHRIGILTITAEAQRAEFGYLREALGLTPGNLSKHLTVLEQAGMIEVEKGYAGRRPRTWVRITAQGRAALAAELTALTELLLRWDLVVKGARGCQERASGPGVPCHGVSCRVPVNTSRSQRVWSASQPASSDAAPSPPSTAILAVLR